MQRFGLASSSSEVYKAKDTESVDAIASNNSSEEIAFGERPSYHALKDHLKRRHGSQFHATSHLGASGNLESSNGLEGVPFAGDDSDLNFMPNALLEERRPSRSSEGRRSRSSLTEARQSRSSLHDAVERRSSLPEGRPSRSSLHNAVESTLLPGAVDSPLISPSSPLSPVSEVTRGSRSRNRFSKRATMDPEQIKVVREKMRRSMKENRLEALKKRGSIQEYELQDEETIRSLGLTPYELHQRALAAGITEEEIEVAFNDRFDPKGVLIKQIVEKEQANVPTLETQAKEYKASMRARFRRSNTSACILSPETLGTMDMEKQAAARKREEDKALPCGFTKGDVVTTIGGHDEDGPWKDSGGVGVILGHSIHGLGFVDVLFDRTGDIYKVKAKNLRPYERPEVEENTSSSRRFGDSPEVKLLPALRGRNPGAAASGFIKGVSIFDRHDQKIDYF